MQVNATKILTRTPVIRYVMIGVGGLIVFLIFRKQIKRLFEKKYDAGTMEKELKKVDVKSYNLTITESKATLITQNIFNAMNRIGTDEDTIIRNLEKLNTKDDLLLVIKIFGIKPYNGWSLTTNVIDRYLYSRDLNLNGWLQSELSGSDLKKVIEIYNWLGVNF